MSQQPKLYLFDHPVSSYAQKVRMALRLKGLAFTAETPAHLGLGQPDAAFEAANPRKEVPALVVDDGAFTVFDSTAILMYLEDAFPTARALLPGDPRDRARARMVEEVCDTHYEAINWGVGEIQAFGRAEGGEAERLVANAQEQTRQIQRWLGAQLGARPFFNGAEVGYADVCVAPMVHRSVAYGFAFADEPAIAQLQAWHARVQAIPAIGDTLAEMGEALKALVARGGGMFRAGSGQRREYRDHRLEWMIKNGGIGIVEQGLRDENIRFSWPHVAQ